MLAPVDLIPILLGGFFLILGVNALRIHRKTRPGRERRLDRLTHATRKRVTLVLPVVVVLSGLLAGIVDARQRLDDAFVIDAFDVRMSIEPDGATVIAEDIVVTFLEPRRGIIRELPPEFASMNVAEPGAATTPSPFIRAGDLTDDEAEHDEPTSRHDREYQVLETTLDDGTVTRRTWRQPSGWYSVRLGSEDVWLEPGTYRYHLRYRAPSWTVRSDESAELAETRVNVPGLRWATRIEQVSLAIWTPGEPSRAACVMGRRGGTQSCDDAVRIDDGVLRADMGPFDAYHGATISLQSPVASFTVAPPVGQHDELGTGWSVPQINLPRPLAGLLLAVLAGLPLAGVSRYERRLIDGPSRKRARSQDYPAVLDHPPEGFEPVEVAGLLHRRTPGDQLLLSRLIRASQQGTITSKVHPERAVFTPVEERSEDLDESLRDLLPLELNKAFNPKIANKLSYTQTGLEIAARNVFRTAGLERDDGSLHARVHGLPSLWRLAGVLAAIIAVLGALATPLTIWTGLAILAVVLAATSVERLLWSHRRSPLSEEAYDLMRLAEAFDRYLATVKEGQMDEVAVQEDADQLHPAVELLPYAVALGRAESWYRRFGAVLTRYAPNDWATQPASPQSFRELQRATLAVPVHRSTSSSGGGGGGGFSGGGFSGGGGGAGSGGGGGGGRSW